MMNSSGSNVAPPVSRGKVAVVGAGPVGCATALALAQRGHFVQVYETRPDLRQNPGAAGLRSINLAISARGIATLRSIDPALALRVTNGAVPIEGRMVHDEAGEQTPIPYGAHGECIYSLSRIELNSRLLDELDRAGIQVNYGHRFVGANLQGRPEAHFEVGTRRVRVHCDLLVGCDGGFSKVRGELQKYTEFNYSQEYLDHFYMEIPVPASMPDGEYVFHPNHLHIWPRKKFMFVALPNDNGTFVGTLFAPRALFRDLDSWPTFQTFFAREFPDAYNAIGPPLLERCYSEHPRGRLMSIKCSPYHLDNKAILLGDAAHSMVPFFGQGLNAGFEDVRVLLRLMDRFPPRRAFMEYSAYRRSDLDAICDLSMQNYVEMRDDVMTSAFRWRKQVDFLLTRLLKDRWLPLYTMVTFRPDIRYSDAVRREARQSLILHRAGIVLQAAAAAPLIALIGYFRVPVLTGAILVGNGIHFTATVLGRAASCSGAALLQAAQYAGYGAHHFGQWVSGKNWQGCWYHVESGFYQAVAAAASGVQHVVKRLPSVRRQQ